MKAQILKIAGVKSEKEFYKKYPSEEAFMKVHGKAFKKAQIGAYIGGEKDVNPKMINFNDSYDAADKMVTGSTETERQKSAYDQMVLQALQAQSQGNTSSDTGGGLSGAMGGIGNIMNMFGGEGGASGAGGAEGVEGIGEMAAMAARYGTNIPRAYNGTNANNWWSGMTTTAQSTYPPNIANTYGISAQTMGVTGGGNAPVNQPGTQGSYGFGGTNYAGPPGAYGPNTSDPNWMNKSNTTIPQVGAANIPSTDQGTDQNLSNKLGGFKKLLGPVGDVIGGIDTLKEEQKQLKVAQQARDLSDLQLKASTTRPEIKDRRYVRPEDIVNTGESFFPIYGVGTNVLARNGARLQGGGMVGGNPTEIQNTYSNGDDIYTDGGYEPLENPFQVKDFRHGGYLHRAQSGWDNWQNSMNGGGSGFSGAGESGGGTPWQAISHEVTGIGQNLMGGQNGGGQIGGTVGKSIGSIFGPVGGAIGEFVGGIAGQQLDQNVKNTKKAQDATRKNVQNIAYNQISPSIQAGYASHMKDGGYVSNDWNPQVIAMFGDHNSEDFADYAHKYRAGGHLKEYTPPSERAMETYEDGGEITSYAMGGQLKTHWGGKAETISHNPYMPGSGETVLFRGQSHTESDKEGNTGIGITYGENPVEVERGEPMFEMGAGGEVNPETGESENTGVVFGNMEINKKIAEQLNDPDLMKIANKFHGKKFKNVGIHLSEQEAKQNKIIDKSSNQLESLKVNTPFDKLKLSSLKANLEGANLKLKDIANTKITLANYQNAINDTKEEMSDNIGQNLSAEHLAKGLIRIDKDPVTKDAKWGATVAKAKAGITTTKQTTVVPKKTREQLIAEGYTKRSDGTWHKEHKGVKKPDRETKSASAMDTIPKQSVDKNTGLYGGVTPGQFEEFKKKNSWYDWSKFDQKNPEHVNDFAEKFNAEAIKRGSPARILPDKDGNGKTTKIGKQYTSGILADEKKSEEPVNTEDIAVEDIPDEIVPSKPRFPWDIPINQAIEYLRPTDQEPLDYNQLLGEMYALSANQLDPVQAQLYHPEIGIPYDISYQDMLNENQADFKGTQKMLGYNPAAQANLDAQKYQANQKVLAEQFRANQAMKDKVYTENRNTLNQAKLTNLGILDKQYERQAEAMSNTKATTQAALNSMSDKYAKNKLENRKLSIYENMYNYRFGKNGKAKNWNGLHIFDTERSDGRSKDTEQDMPGYKATSYDKNGNVLTWKKIAPEDVKDDVDAVEAIGKEKNGGSVKKNYKNSSVVRAYKNL